MAERIIIAFFSGTGGTAACASALAESFLVYGVSANVVNLDAQTRTLPELSTDDLMILLYAVHAFDAPEIVYDWIKLLPDVCCRVALVPVTGGGHIWPNTACWYRPGRALERRHMRIVYETMLVMPTNVVMEVPFDLGAALYAVLPAKCEKIVSDLMSGVHFRQTRNPLAIFPALISPFEKFGARRFGQGLTADSRCIACGKCVRQCPRRNITMNDFRPSFGKHCIFCMRCIYGCPAQALYHPHFPWILPKTRPDLAGMASATDFDPERALTAATGGYTALKKYLSGCLPLR